MQQSQIFSATLKSVSDFVTKLENAFAGMTSEVRVPLILAIQELCVNIVKHAYAGESGPIQVSFEWSDDGITFTIEDQASKGFVPPDEITVPDPLTLPESGLGLFIIYQTFDHVDYERTATGNRWFVTKSLGEV